MGRSGAGRCRLVQVQCQCAGCVPGTAGVPQVHCAGLGACVSRRSAQLVRGQAVKGGDCSGVGDSCGQNSGPAERPTRSRAEPGIEGHDGKHLGSWLLQVRRGYPAACVHRCRRPCSSSQQARPVRRWQQKPRRAAVPSKGSKCVLMGRERQHVHGRHAVLLHRKARAPTTLGARTGCMHYAPRMRDSCAREKSSTIAPLHGCVLWR